MSPHPGYRRFKKNPGDFIPGAQRREPVKSDHFLAKLGKAIRQTRKQRNMTQEDLAEVAGMNTKHLGEVESGKANPTVLLLLKISSALHVGLLSLFFDGPSLDPQDALEYEEIMALVRRLDQPDRRKLHRLLKAIVE